MSGDELKQLMLAEINKSTVFQIDKDLATATALTDNGFYTSAFLQYWQITEVTAKELMLIAKFAADCVDVTNKTLKTLRKHLKASGTIVDEAKIKQDLQTSFITLFKPKAEQSSRNLDIGAITKSLKTLGLAFNDEYLKFLLGTKVDNLPVGIQFSDKSTVRERRNQLVHRNGQISNDDLNVLLPVFDYFFDLIKQVKNNT